MPLVLAFVASALLHAAALVGPGWMLPGSGEPEPPPQTIDAVIARAPPRSETVPAKPSPRPAPKAKPPPPAPPALATPAPVADTPALTTPEPTPASVPQAAPPPPPPVAAAEPAVPPPAKTALPGRGRQRYLVTRGEGGFVIGQAIYTWEHDGYRYRLRSLIETTGLAAVFRPSQSLGSSEGEVTDEGLRPRQFRQERAGGTDIASFDWLARSVSYAGRIDPIVNGTQDLLSMYYQLMLQVPTGGILEMPIATGRKLETYRFEALGTVMLALPAGERPTIHVRARGGGDTIEIWLHAGEGAAARGMPLKIRFIDRKGEIFDQIAEQYMETK